MKQTITIAFLVLITYTSVAQKIRFSDSGNAWHEQFGNMNTGGVRKYEVYGDTIINSVVYKATSIPGYTTGKTFVREDTAKNQVIILDDTNEYILYDYNLNIGDTIFYLYGNNHYVSSIDSVQIDSVWHKVFYFKGGTKGGWPYAVVEGIGCIDGLLFPLDNYSVVEAHFRVICFHHSGIKSQITPPILYGNYGISKSFSNTDSCYVSITEPSDIKKTVKISPHPANATSKITLPYTFTGGSIVIFNTMGQVVTEQTIYNQSKIPVDLLKLNTGLYYYNITDAKSGKTWQGKLVYK